MEDDVFPTIDDASSDSDDSDVEMPYESMPRISREFNEKPSGIQRLPIKLNDGTIKDMGRNLNAKIEEEENEEAEEAPVPVPSKRIEDVSTGARFGRAAVVDVISKPSRKARVQESKEQIASICQDIVAEPEMSVRARLVIYNVTNLSFCAAWSTQTSPLFCFRDGDKPNSS